MLSFQGLVDCHARANTEARNESRAISDAGHKHTARRTLATQAVLFEIRASVHLPSERDAHWQCHFEVAQSTGRECDERRVAPEEGLHCGTPRGPLQVLYCLLQQHSCQHRAEFLIFFGQGLWALPTTVCDSAHCLCRLPISPADRRLPIEIITFA